MSVKTDAGFTGRYLLFLLLDEVREVPLDPLGCGEIDHKIRATIQTGPKRSQTPVPTLRVFGWAYQASFATLSAGANISVVDA